MLSIWALRLREPKGLMPLTPKRQAVSARRENRDYVIAFSCSFGALFAKTNGSFFSAAVAITSIRL
jgi:hypothetical protein